MKKTLSIAAFAALLAGPAMAETVITKTYVAPVDVENVNEINFTVFDVNNDGIYSMEEVGSRLFESFDTNNDELIDNTEWDDRQVLTIIPIEKETFRFVDYDDDNIVETSSYNYSTFYTASGLAKFDDNADGLSASDFVNASLQEMDDNEDNLINLEEWQEAYLQTRPEHNQPENYNN
jgi:hypothetical protein